MTHRERVRAAAAFRRPDRIPVGPYMANHCSVAMGYALRDCCTDPEKLAEAQYRAWLEYGQDILNVQCDNYYIPEAFGARILLPQDPVLTPSMLRSAIGSLEQVKELSLPDPRKDGRMPVYIRAMELLRGRCGDEACLRACGVGPFTLAAHLRGTEDFLMEVMEAISEEDEEKEAKLLSLIQLCTDTLVAFAGEMLAAGADIVQCADSLASLDMISPEIYERFAYPFEKQFFERMKSPCADRGAIRLLHICGGNSLVYPFFRKLGADLIEIDSKVELSFARAQLGEDSTAIIGNLAPVAVLMQGSPETVREEAQRAIAAAGETGFILGSGCEVPIGAPRENIRTMIRAAREYRLGQA